MFISLPAEILAMVVATLDWESIELVQLRTHAFVGMEDNALAQGESGQIMIRWVLLTRAQGSELGVLVVFLTYQGWVSLLVFRPRPRTWVSLQNAIERYCYICSQRMISVSAAAQKSTHHCCDSDTGTTGQKWKYYSGPPSKHRQLMIDQTPADLQVQREALDQAVKMLFHAPRPASVSGSVLRIQRRRKKERSPPLRINTDPRKLWQCRIHPPCSVFRRLDLSGYHQDPHDDQRGLNQDDKEEENEEFSLSPSLLSTYYNILPDPSSSPTSSNAHDLIIYTQQQRTSKFPLDARPPSATAQEGLAAVRQTQSEPTSPINPSLSETTIASIRPGGHARSHSESDLVQLDGLSSFNQVMTENRAFYQHEGVGDSGGSVGEGSSGWWQSRKEERKESGGGGGGGGDDSEGNEETRKDASLGKRKWDRGSSSSSFVSPSLDSHSSEDNHQGRHQDSIVQRREWSKRVVRDRLEVEHPEEKKQGRGDEDEMREIDEEGNNDAAAAGAAAARLMGSSGGGYEAKGKGKKME